MLYADTNPRSVRLSTSPREVRFFGPLCPTEPEEAGSKETAARPNTDYCEGTNAAFRFPVVKERNWII
jgi:hypothetical protein